MRENNDIQCYKDMEFKIAPISMQMRKFYIFFKEHQIKYFKELFTRVIEERVKFINSLGFSEYSCINVSFEDKGGISIEFAVVNDDLNYERVLAKVYSAMDLIDSFIIDKDKNQDIRDKNILKRNAKNTIPLIQTTLDYMKDIKIQSKLITKNNEKIESQINTIISLLDEISSNFVELSNS